MIKKKSPEKHYCKCGREIDYEFIKHTVAIICRSFPKANEVIEILQQEGIFKRKRK